MSAADYDARIMDICLSIKRGIDIVRARGVNCFYPRVVVIDGNEYLFPWSN